MSTGGLHLSGLGLRHPGASGWALRGVDLSVEPGEVLAVVGPSGSGKTTLLRLVCGLLQPTEGEVRIGVEDQARVPPERRPVAMVFQGFALFPHLTVAENLGFGLRVRKVRRAERAARVGQVAAALGLSELLDRQPVALSGGERQRVALGRALVRDPAVFCLDEPLSALDPLLRADARRELAALLRAEGRCAVFVTHDQTEAMTLGDRVAVLRGGRLEQVDRPRALYDRPGTPFVASFVGSPAMSLLERPEGLVGVRAEHVRLVPGDDALVSSVEDHGHETHVLLETSGGRLVARVPAGQAPSPGARTGVQLGQVVTWPGTRADHGLA